MQEWLIDPSRFTVIQVRSGGNFIGTEEEAYQKQIDLWASHVSIVEEELFKARQNLLKARSVRTQRSL